MPSQANGYTIWYARILAIVGIHYSILYFKYLILNNIAKQKHRTDFHNKQFFICTYFINNTLS